MILVVLVRKGEKKSKVDYFTFIANGTLFEVFTTDSSFLFDFPKFKKEESVLVCKILKE